jgi:hypothetical protein
MKAIKRTNLKTLTVIAAALLSMASLAIPIQESRAGDGGGGGGNTKGDEGIEQMNKCNDYATCVNMWCKAALECYMIIPQENFMRFPMPTNEESD